MISRKTRDNSRKPIFKTRDRGLLRVLGMSFGVAVIVGNIIGSGILRTPGEVAARLPNPSLYMAVWFGGGIYALLGALSVAELGAMLPRSGGQYVFAHRALGTYAGFVVGWSDWISTCGTSAAIAIIIAEYANVLVPTLRVLPAWSIASVTLIAFALLQQRGVLWGSRAQEFTSLLKALAFLVLVVSCFLVGSKAFVGTASALPTDYAFVIAIILAIQSVIYTYGGWTGLVYFSEELRSPQRDVPRAMLAGVVLVIIIYLLVNLALIYVLPMSQLAGEKLAVGAAAERAFGEYGDRFVRSLMIISMLGAINAYQLQATRVLYGMSRDGLFFRRLSVVNPGGTPTHTLLVSTVIALLFTLSGTFNTVLAILAFFFVLNYSMSFVSVFVLRAREPDLPRPYRAWGFPWTTGFVLMVSIAFLVGALFSDTRNSLYALGLILASYPVYRLLINRSRPPQNCV